jgi:enoyl-CoA hydratase/carnithine racemase
MAEKIDIAVDGGVLIITINRPDKKNALDGAMYDAMTGALARAAAADEIGAVLIGGTAGVFTAGNDLADFLASAATTETMPAGRFIHSLARFEKPIVAAVDGPAVGIGTTLCFHCDLVYAAPGARFQMPFVSLGLVPEAGSSLLAVQRFGLARAAEYLMLGDAFDAATAARIGLANAVVEAADLHAHALAKAKALAAKPRAALLATRRLLRGDPEPLHAQMAREDALFAEALASPDAKAAFNAFLQKSKR